MQVQKVKLLQLYFFLKKASLIHLKFKVEAKKYKIEFESIPGLYYGTGDTFAALFLVIFKNYLHVYFLDQVKLDLMNIRGFTTLENNAL